MSIPYIYSLKLLLLVFSCLFKLMLTSDVSHFAGGYLH